MKLLMFAACGVLISLASTALADDDINLQPTQPQSDPGALTLPPDPGPPPASEPFNIPLGTVGGTAQPGTNPNTGPQNPDQAPSPSATPGIIIKKTIP